MIHEAFIYSSDHEYAAVLVPFLREAVAAGQPAIAVTAPDRARLIQRELGADASSILFFDADEWYRRPGAAVQEWEDVLAQQAGQAELIRAVGDVRFGDDAAEQALWMRYESLFNRAFADTPAWVVCTYDARTASEELLAGVRRSHPIVTTASSRGTSPEHFSLPELGAAIGPLSTVEVPSARHAQPVVITDNRELPAIRRRLTWPALVAGLSRDSVEDLTMAVTALAAAAVGTGRSASIRAFSTGTEWICQVSSDGSIRSLNELQSAAPLIIGRLVCDRVELSAGPEGFVVRFVVGPPRDPRRRILAAANLLFPEHGFRRTGINAIIAQAGVAKATFYACFASKDELILEWIRSPEAQRFRDVWAEVEARTPQPADQLVQFFDILAEWLAETDFGGWPLLTTMNEFEGVEHPARADLVRSLSEPEETFRAAATAAGLADPQGVGARLNILHLGAITAASISKSRRPVDIARAGAAVLIEAAVRKSS
jgi:AcrR family transcriptional regulator